MEKTAPFVDALCIMERNHGQNQYTKEEVMQLMNESLHKEIDYYKDFINNTEIDPIAEMEEYVNKCVYKKKHR